MPAYDFDLAVIGSGPAGQRAAIQAAKLEKRVAVIEKKTVVGGVCINTGTIPSKTLREAVLLPLSGYRERSVYGRFLHGQAKHHDAGPAVPVPTR
jgi:NAD(P) transhydrogenase